MRRPVVAGNWKMNPPSLDEAIALAEVVEIAAAEHPRVTTVVCPPSIWLAEVARAAPGLHVGAQTMHFEERGAFTGETSPLMLAGLATFVILGHSERRQYDGETDESVGRKVASAVAHGLRPIAAVGERAEERRAGDTERVVERQLRAALAGIDRLAGTGLVIAYEPVWAIGTGRTATPQQAEEAIAFIRSLVAARSSDVAAAMRILYGGSVKPDNAAELLGREQIDGALVGGASLDARDFAAIVAAA
jgi:triosephosphate isomerase (TIM)